MSATTDLRWGLDKLGRWTELQEFEVTPERTTAYAKATNDEHPKHLSGELAPPVFAIVPVFETIAPKIAGVVPGELLMRGVHGEQDFVFHRPIVPGETLSSRAAAVGVHGTSTGVMVIGTAQTVSSSGEPVVDQHMTYYVRGAQLDVHEGHALTEHGRRRIAFETTTDSGNVAIKDGLAEVAGP